MKARICHASPETNPGKLQKLDELHQNYISCVQVCIAQMVRDRIVKIFPSQRRTYFPTSKNLSSQILKNAQTQAAKIVETWAKGRYHKLKKNIREHEGLTDLQRMELRCIGKYVIIEAKKFGKATITREMVDLYYGWLWNPEISGRPPKVSDNLPMMMSEMTCVFGPSKESNKFTWWIRCSTLHRGRTIEVPLSPNPYLKIIDGLAKTVLVKKRDGRWTFQFCEKAEEPEFDGSHGEVGVDVGLNVIAATSDGRLYGQEFKPRFDQLHKRVRDLRANRQRQELRRDSKRLARLEARLSGMVKTATGTVANKLVRDYPSHTFVVEDLNLRGCKGQKRFAYRALHHSLSHKAKVKAVNPAYTSQTCPSCGYISRNNRSGIKFCCRSCGRISHADVVGGINLLRRSQDKQVGLIEDHRQVKQLLRERYLTRRNPGRDSFVALRAAPVPSGRRLTTKGSRLRDIGTASNPIPRIT